MFLNGVGDGAELLGAAFVVGFEFGDEEPLVGFVVVEGGERGGEGGWGVGCGVVE